MLHRPTAQERSWKVIRSRAVMCVCFNLNCVSTGDAGDSASPRRDSCHLSSSRAFFRLSRPISVGWSWYVGVVVISFRRRFVAVVVGVRGCPRGLWLRSGIMPSSSSSSSSCSTLFFPASLFPSSSSLETFVLALAMTIGLLQLAITKADCPETCSCKWKGGKQTVECVNASLSAIPNIEKDTQVLDLSHNYLPVLPMDIFLTLHLPNLQKIYLARSSVKTVADHCFRWVRLTRHCHRSPERTRGDLWS